MSWQPSRRLCAALRGCPCSGTVSGIREWFRWYKTPDGKPVNGFGHGEKALGKAQALKVIEETHAFYLELVRGQSERGKLWVPA